MTLSPDLFRQETLEQVDEQHGSRAWVWGGIFLDAALLVGIGFALGAWLK